ncbi:MAG: hypothetical protein SO314_00005, partial [Alphaproteobacteria bacterium]|nr:hypothetical protein [Alphaproteobacteria bacterium]
MTKKKEFLLTILGTMRVIEKKEQRGSFGTAWTADRVKHVCFGRKPMKNINRNMLHMKLKNAVSVFAVAAAFSVLLPPSNAYCGICFLPDCQDSDTVQGDINLNINEDSEYCEKKGYTYYSSGQCP